MWNGYVHEQAHSHNHNHAETPSLDASQWTNLNSFLARATKEQVVRFEELSVELVELALEERQGLNRLEALLASAGVWMVVMGEEVWGWLSSRTKKGAAEERELVRKWQFWKERFIFLSRRENLAISSRELASEAEAVMNRAA